MKCYKQNKLLKYMIYTIQQQEENYNKKIKNICN